MRHVLLLAAGLGIAIAAPPPAEAQTGFTPCGDRVTAQNWSRHPRQPNNTFRWQVTLLAPAAVQVQIQLLRGPGLPQRISLTAEALRPLNLRGGVPLTLWVAESIDPFQTSAVVSATRFSCAAPAG